MTESAADRAARLALALAASLRREAVLMSTLMAEHDHLYLSTACHHVRHDQCRLTCKFCPAACGCACHST